MGLDLPFDDDEPITSFGAGRRSYIEKTGPPSPTSSRQRSRIGAETLEGVQLTSTSR